MKSERKRYSKMGLEIGKLVEEKQIAYGDSFGRSGACLREMFPDGIPPTKYDDVLTIARILDKLFRIATNQHAFGENPYKDIAGYSILGYGRHQKQHENNTNKRRRKGTTTNRKRERSKGTKRKVSR